MSPEPASAEALPATTPTPGKRRGFSFPKLGSLGLASLFGSERHEAEPETPRATKPGEPEAPARPTTERASDRFSFLSLKAETRVGTAALLSFVVLVTVMVVKKGWVGKPIALAMQTPGDGKLKDKPGVDPKDPGRGPSKPPAKDVPVLPPGEVTPGDTSTREILAGDRKVEKVDHPPTTDPDRSAELSPSNLAPISPPTAPSMLPPQDDLPTSKDPIGTAKPTELPPVVADAPTLPGDPAPTPPAPPPAPAVEPGTPAVPASTGPPAVPPSPSPNPAGEPPAMPPAYAGPAEPPPSQVAPQPPAPKPSAERIEAGAPVRSEKPLTLDPIPAAASGSPMVAAAEAAGAVGAGWVVIQGGGRKPAGAEPSASPSEGPAEPPRVADGPRVNEDVAADQVEPVLHRVKPGENFWTISRFYYRSGRYYRALHAANERQVPNIRELYVGTVLRIPPPESLERSLIDPPTGGKVDGPATSTVSRTSKQVEPSEADELARPVRPRSPRPDPEADDQPSRRPTYIVKPYETLRGIARDTLNDPKRYREIYNLNRDVLDDPSILPAGTTLTLPEDATLGRRGR